MDLGIKGKSAIICASSRGLGKACAYSLAINGVNIILNGRDEDVLEKTKVEIATVASDIKISAIVLNYNRPHNLDILIPELLKIKQIDEIIISHGSQKTEKLFVHKKIINETQIINK